MAIKQLRDEKKPVSQNQKKDWGVFTYFYNDGKCDHFKNDNLEQGQTFYRNRGNDDVAKIFIAEGEVTRSKGDQVAIECCTGKALMEGNLKLKTFEQNQVYVVNHETDTIYNDVQKFEAKQMEQAMAQFAQYPAKDATVIISGTDGKILKKKGDELYIAQNLAYLYNDTEHKGEIQDRNMEYTNSEEPDVTVPANVGVVQKVKETEAHIEISIV